MLESQLAGISVAKPGHEEVLESKPELLWSWIHQELAAV